MEFKLKLLKVGKWLTEEASEQLCDPIPTFLELLTVTVGDAKQIRKLVTILVVGACH